MTTIHYDVAPGGSAWARSTATAEIDDLPKSIRETERDLHQALKRVSRLSEALGKADSYSHSTAQRRNIRVNLDLACAHRDTMESKLAALREALPLHPVQRKGPQ